MVDTVCKMCYNGVIVIGRGDAMNLLTVYEAAERLGLSHQRVRQLIDQGRLPARKVGRDWVILESDLESAELDDLRKRYSTPPTPDVVLVREAAKLLGVSRQRVYEFLRSGRLDGVKANESRYTFVTRDSVQRLAEERERATGRRTPRPRGAPVPEDRRTKPS